MDVADLNVPPVDAFIVCVTQQATTTAMLNNTVPTKYSRSFCSFSRLSILVASPRPRLSRSVNFSLQCIERQLKTYPVLQFEAKIITLAVVRGIFADRAINCFATHPFVINVSYLRRGINQGLDDSP